MPMIIDLQGSNTIVPQGAPVTCNATGSACTLVKTKTDKEVTFQSVTVNTTQAVTRFNFGGVSAFLNTTADDEEKSMSNMTIRYVDATTKTSPNTWPFKQGVLSLSPVSSLWSYLFSNYQFTNDEIISIIDINSQEGSSPMALFGGAEAKENSTLFDGSFFTITDDEKRVSGKSVLNFTQIASNSQYWKMPTASLSVPGLNISNIVQGDVCIDVSKSEAISVRDQGLRVSLIKQINEDLCGADVCGINTTITNLPPLQLSMLDGQGYLQNYTIPVEDFVFKREKATQLSIEIGSVGQTGCSAALSVGRLFLIKSSVVFKAKKTGQLFLAIYPPASNESRGVLSMIVSAFVVIILIFVGLMAFRSLSGVGQSLKANQEHGSMGDSLLSGGSQTITSGLAPSESE